MTLSGVAARTPDGRSLFSDLTLAFGRERTGVVGRNGAGKSTLLRLIAGLSTPAEGEVSRACAVGWLQQDEEGLEVGMVSDLLGASEAIRRLDRVIAGQGSDEDLDRADWALEERIAGALIDVGLPGLDLRKPASSLSGGERTRVRLAGLLLSGPDLLILDEPTNHLDPDGRRAVSDLLARWRGGAIVVSHDRALLRCMDRIVELSELGVGVHGGGYDLYAGRKAAERAAAERDLEAAERDLDRAARENRSALERKARRDRAGRAFAARRSEPRILLGAMAERAENSSGRERQLALRRTAEAEAGLGEAKARVERTRALSIPMPPTGLTAGRTVVEAVDLVWTAPDGRTVLGPESLRLIGPERVAVAGRNGAGKSTLMRLLLGELEPTGGMVTRSVEGVFLDQDVRLLRPEETLFEAYRRINPEATPNAARASLARFLFRSSAAERTVGSLSGGERLRAALACVMTGLAPPQLLALDEPTNHLDLESVEAVEEALRDYDGALLVVSHDPDFLDAIGIDRVVALS